MQKSERMSRVESVAKSREDEAVEVYGRSRQQVAENIKRLKELEEYRNEYLRRMHEEGEKGVSAAKLRDIQGFINKIDQGINAQKDQLKRSEQQLELDRKHWLAARNRTKTMGTVVERYKQSEQRTENRREQKELDEYAQRSKHGDSFE